VARECAKDEGANAEVVEENGRLPALDKVREEEADGRGPPAEVCHVEVEENAGLRGRKLGRGEHANEATDDGKKGKGELDVERAVATKDRKLHALLLNDEVEDPVEGLSKPPAGSSSLVSEGVLLNLDVAEESVENVILHGHDGLDDESKNANNREGILADIDETKDEVLIRGLPVTLEHGTTEEEQKRL